MTASEQDLEDHPDLVAAARLDRRVQSIHWFSSLGDPLSDEDRKIARAYLDELGFPYAEPALVTHLEDAAASVESNDINSAGWEAEEQMRTALLDEALQMVDETNLMIALQSVPASAATHARAAAEEAALHFGMDDEEIVNAMVGAASRATYMATLALLAEKDENHPAAHRFHLFERGRWPLDIVGSTFNIF
ncbi:MAG: hypothetical protein KAI28_10480 [Sphingomonadales bacterium]|nr:hypothetical protein [Sphingomonadales bacterium]